MPRYNGMGPMCQVAVTGWGMGTCGARMGYGRRVGGGRGLGLRRFWGYYPTAALSKKEEVEILSEDAELMEEELKSIKVRLSELKNQK